MNAPGSRQEPSVVALHEDRALHCHGALDLLVDVAVLPERETFASVLPHQPLVNVAAVLVREVFGLLENSLEQILRRTVHAREGLVHVKMQVALI